MYRRHADKLALVVLACDLVVTATVWVGAYMLRFGLWPAPDGIPELHLVLRALPGVLVLTAGGTDDFAEWALPSRLTDLQSLRCYVSSTRISEHGARCNPHPLAFVGRMSRPRARCAPRGYVVRHRWGKVMDITGPWVFHMPPTPLVVAELHQ